MEKKLPEGWKEYKIKDIGDVVTGSTPPKKDPENYGGVLPWIKPPDLDIDKFVSTSEETISETGRKKVRLLPRGSVLVSCIGNIGKVAIADTELCTNQQINSIIPDENIVVSDFLYYTIKKIRPYLENIASSAVVPLLNKTDFSNINIKLPPLETQQKIVSILEKAEETKKLRAQADDLTQKLLQSEFLEMFGDPVKNPMGWDKKKIGNISTHVSSGSTPKGGKEVYQKEGTLFIRSQNVHMNRLVYEDIAYISREIHNSMRRTWVQKGDVLLNITGASIGRVAWYSGNNNEANVNQHVCIIRPKQSIVKPEFLSYQISMESYQNKTLSQQSGATRQAFNYSQIKDFDSIVPSVDLQQNFVSIIGKIEEIKKSQQQSSLEINNLFDALMQKAFTGKLVS